MNFTFRQILSSLALCLVAASVSGISDASDESDRAEIIDASGRYRGNFNGIFVVGEDASAIDNFQSSTRMPRKKGRFTSRFLIEEFEGSFAIEGNVRKIKVRGK